MRIRRTVVRRDGSRARNFGPNLEYTPPTPTPPHTRLGQDSCKCGEGVAEGLLETAQWTEVRSAVYTKHTSYTPHLLLTGLITDCAPLVLIIWTWFLPNLLINT